MVSIIAAIGKNRELGKDNKLLWHIPKDLEHFKKITLGHPIIMGRKTFESIGKPLPQRTNIIVSRSFARSDLAKLNVIIAGSLEEALRQAQDKQGSDEIFIIGGGQIFEQAIKFADKLYLTLVELASQGEALQSFDADTFFPDYSMFRKKVFEEKGEDGGYKYIFLELEK